MIELFAYKFGEDRERKIYSRQRKKGERKKGSSHTLYSMPEFSTQTSSNNWSKWAVMRLHQYRFVQSDDESVIWSQPSAAAQSQSRQSNRWDRKNSPFRCGFAPTSRWTALLLFTDQCRYQQHVHASGFYASTRSKPSYLQTTCQKTVHSHYSEQR